MPKVLTLSRRIFGVGSPSQEPSSPSIDHAYPLSLAWTRLQQSDEKCGREREGASVGLHVCWKCFGVREGTICLNKVSE